MHRRQFDADLEEEMRLHLEMLQQEHLETGMKADEARAAARRRFGNVTALREMSRMALGWEWFEHLEQDSTLHGVIADGQLEQGSGERHGVDLSKGYAGFYSA